MVRTVDPPVDERQFNDALTANLRRGRFLLLIVGDGIREGVEAISRVPAGTRRAALFLGLVELPIYIMPNGDRLVSPRVLARTTIVTRNVVALPDGTHLGANREEEEIGPKEKASTDDFERFWGLSRDLGSMISEQAKPKPSRGANIKFPLPAPNSRLTVYRMQSGHVGVFLSSTKDTTRRYAMQTIVTISCCARMSCGGPTQHQGTLSPIGYSQPLGRATERQRVFLARRECEHLRKSSASATLSRQPCYRSSAE